MAALVRFRHHLAHHLSGEIRRDAAFAQLALQVAAAHGTKTHRFSAPCFGEQAVGMHTLRGEAIQGIV